MGHPVSFHLFYAKSDHLPNCDLSKNSRDLVSTKGPILLWKGYVVKEPSEQSTIGLFFSVAHASAMASATPSTPFYFWNSITSAPLLMSVTDIIWLLTVDLHSSREKSLFLQFCIFMLVLLRLHSTMDYPYCSGWFGKSFHTRPRLSADVGQCQHTFPSSVSADPWGAFRAVSCQHIPVGTISFHQRSFISIQSWSRPP